MNHKTRCTLAIGDSFRSAAVPGFQVEHCASNSRLVENRSDTVGKEQLASLAFRSDSMLAVDGCSLVFLEGRVFN